MRGLLFMVFLVFYNSSVLAMKQQPNYSFLVFNSLSILKKVGTLFYKSKKSKSQKKIARSLFNKGTMPNRLLDPLQKFTKKDLTCWDDLKNCWNFTRNCVTKYEDYIKDYVYHCSQDSNCWVCGFLCVTASCCACKV